MKKKWPLLLLMTIGLSTVGAFYYNGAPKQATATPVENKQITDGIEEKHKEIVEKFEKSPDENSTEQTNEEKQAKQPVKGSNSEEYGEKPFIYSGYEYWRITHDEEYTNLNYLVELAEINRLELYGINQSDVFILVRDGEVVGNLTVGAFRVIPEEINFAKSYLSYDNYPIYEKMIPNIDFVLEHDVKVSVYDGEMDLVTIYKDEAYVYFFYT